jgi:predicted Zn-dependent peptidase
MTETLISRNSPPPVRDIEKINVARAEFSTLDNGIPVYSISAGFQELVKVELLFSNNSFDIKKPLLNSATNRMLSEGTSKYNSQQLADHIDYYGAFYETDENSDYTSVILYTLNKHLEATLPFIADLIYDPVFPEKELGVYIQNNKQRLTVENEKVNSLARRKFNEIIFGQTHPYGYFVETADYDTLDRQSVVEHHSKKYRPSNCTIIISGLIPANSIKLLNKHFGQAPFANGSHTNGVQNIFTPSTIKKNILEKNDAVQSAIRIGKSFFNRTHPDYPGMAVVNTLLGGYFGSRLMSNIREEKGYTYGIGSAIVSMKQEGYFFISTEVGAEVTADALKEIYVEIEGMKDDFVEKDELEMVRNYMLGTFLKSTDGAFQLAERFKSIYLYGLDYSYYERYLEKIRTITPDEIQLLARKYFDTAGFYELVVGKK